MSNMSEEASRRKRWSSAVDMRTFAPLPEHDTLLALSRPASAADVHKSRMASSRRSEPRYAFSSATGTSPGHARSLSLATYTPSKRLSLSFAPSHSPTADNEAAKARAAMPPPPRRSSEMNPLSGTFLVAIAAQERKVLELREELNRAELELEQLKHNWTLQEATRSRIEHGNSPSRVAPSAHTADIEDAEARKARRESLLMGTRRGQRKVISGQGHIRKLSLLASHSTPAEETLFEAKESPEFGASAEVTPCESTCPSPQLDNPQRGSAASITNILSPHMREHRESFFATGKLFAEEFKDGLWTFFEDLRQATVGDEISAPSTTRRSSIARSPHSPAKPFKSPDRSNHSVSDASKRSPLIDLTDDEINKPQTSPLPMSRSHTFSDPSVAFGIAEVESSVNVSPSWSNTTFTSENSTKANSISEDSDTADVVTPGKRSSISWPLLGDITPTATAIKKTATNFMKEIEKNLTIPPESSPELSDGYAQ